MTYLLLMNPKFYHTQSHIHPSASVTPTASQTGTAPANRSRYISFSFATNRERLSIGKTFSSSAVRVGKGPAWKPQESSVFFRWTRSAKRLWRMRGTGIVCHSSSGASSWIINPVWTAKWPRSLGPSAWIRSEPHGLKPNLGLA
ncbi:hypothetical protein J6590_080250 [Homalodisca vitripennis]|nr:hypothetical protein J6590_080250 [Homalodisca vitripennis]